jgi:hypothetical protein
MIGIWCSMASRSQRLSAELEPVPMKAYSTTSSPAWVNAA